MSEKPISPLRQRMIEDMSVRNFGEKTRNDYIRATSEPLQPFSAARRIRQGPEGSLCDALASAARSLTRLVSHCAAGSVVVPWPRSAAAVNDAPVQPRRSRRRRDGRDQEAGDASHAAA